MLRPFLVLTAIRDEAGQTDTARVDGMDCQALRDWVHRFNVKGHDRQRDHRYVEPACPLNGAQ